MMDPMNYRTVAVKATLLTTLSIVPFTVPSAPVPEHSHREPE